MPHLVNLNEDALMSECLLYQLKFGRTVVRLNILSHSASPSDQLTLFDRSAMLLAINLLISD
jgi:hypothetical protein